MTESRLSVTLQRGLLRSGPGCGSGKGLATRSVTVLAKSVTHMGHIGAREQKRYT